MVRHVSFFDRIQEQSNGLEPEAGGVAAHICGLGAIVSDVQTWIGLRLGTIGLVEG